MLRCLLISMVFVGGCASSNSRGAPRDLQADRLREILALFEDESSAVRTAARERLNSWWHDAGTTAEATLLEARATSSLEGIGNIDLVLHEISAARAYTSALDSCGVERISSLRFVTFCFGDEDPALEQGVSGWVVEECALHVRLLLERGILCAFVATSFPTPAQQRRAMTRGEGISGAWIDRDFADYAEAALRQRIPNEDVDYSSNNGPALDFCILARWADELGLSWLCCRLVDRSWEFLDWGTPLSAHLDLNKGPHAERLTYWLAAELRRSAMRAARDDEDWELLEQRWKRIAGIRPCHRWSNEAAETAERIDDMLEPTRMLWPDETTPPEQQAEFWVRMLPEINATLDCWNPPGRTSIWSMRDEPDRPNPAQRLLKLGEAARPAIIAHLEDTSPTRSYDCFRTYCPDTYSLITVGECCEEILGRMGKAPLPSPKEEWK